MSTFKYPKPPEAWSHLRFWKYLYPGVCEKIGDPSSLTPHHTRWFKALELVPPEKVKVIIIGARPYVDPKASGIAFDCSPLGSVRTITLDNIHQEYTRDLRYPKPRLPTLVPWTEKGVLLLNANLTTENVPLHDMRTCNATGWEMLAYEIVSLLSYERKGLVWMLWSGEISYLQGAIWNPEDHMCIVTSHPCHSYRNVNAHVDPFLGSSCFSRACEYMNVDRSFWRLQ